MEGQGFLFSGGDNDVPIERGVMAASHLWARAAVRGGTPPPNPRALLGPASASWWPLVSLGLSESGFLPLSGVTGFLTSDEMRSSRWCRQNSVEQWGGGVLEPLPVH